MIYFKTREQNIFVKTLLMYLETKTNHSQSEVFLALQNQNKASRKEKLIN